MLKSNKHLKKDVDEAPALKVTPSTPLQSDLPAPSSPEKPASVDEVLIKNKDEDADHVSQTKSYMGYQPGHLLKKLFSERRLRSNSDVSEDNRVFDPTILPVDLRPQWVFAVGNLLPDNAFPVDDSIDSAFFVSRGRNKDGVAIPGSAGHHMEPAGCHIANFVQSEKNPISLITGLAALGVNTVTNVASEATNSRNTPQIKNVVEFCKEHEVLVIPPYLVKYYQFINYSGVFEGAHGTAVVSGYDRKGNVVYIARAHHQESKTSPVIYVPGYLIAGTSQVRYIFNNKDRNSYKYDILCWVGPADIDTAVRALYDSIALYNKEKENEYQKENTMNSN